jgi:hypothetical protein
MIREIGMEHIQKTMPRHWKNIKSYLGWEDMIAVLLILLGVFGYFQGPVPYIPHLTDFYLDFRSDLIGIGITVLIIDNVNEMYRRRAEKERLILQMGSPEHGFAIEAARQLHNRGWLDSLEGANLSKADLSNTHLSNVNLSRSNLLGVNFSGASLIGANLSKANLRLALLRKTDLRGANLSEVDLNHADLRGARLVGRDLRQRESRGATAEENGNRTFMKDALMSGADLSNSNLSQADVSASQLASVRSLAGTIMPDGNVYEPAIYIEIARLRKERELDQSG